MFPCPVSMVVRFPVNFSFIFSRLSMSGKYSFVVCVCMYVCIFVCVDEYVCMYVCFIDLSMLHYTKQHYMMWLFTLHFTLLDIQSIVLLSVALFILSVIPICHSAVSSHNQSIQYMH
jgi:hypothetical protein